MIISYNDNGVINPVEEFLLICTNKLVSLLRPVTWVPLIISWIIGLVLLSTFGLLYTTVLYFPMMIARKMSKREVKAIIANIDSLPQRNAMELLAKIEFLKFKITGFLSKGRPFYVFIPLMHEAKKTLIQLKKAESVLYNKAYPNANTTLTKEGGQELLDIFNDWSEDWNVNEMDIYND